MSRESGALVVCAEMRKLLREPEEEALDDEREMFAFRALWGGGMCQHAAHSGMCWC